MSAHQIQGAGTTAVTTLSAMKTRADLYVHAVTGSPAAFVTQMEGSFDNINWFPLGHPVMQVNQGSTSSGIGFKYLRVSTNFTGGTNPAAELSFNAT